jgi:hypothetical protein
MKLHETNWDAPGGAATVEVEYPDALIQDFMNWIRKTTAWLENPELVERRVRRLNGLLADHRNTVGPSASPVATTGLLGRMADPAFRAAVEAALREYRLIQAKVNRTAALERARAAKKEKAGAV